MTRKTFWVWTLFITTCAILIFPALIPDSSPSNSSQTTPAPAGYTLPFTPLVDSDENPVGNITIIGAQVNRGFEQLADNNTCIWDKALYNGTGAFARQDTSTGTGASRQASIQVYWNEYLEIFKTDLIASPRFYYSSGIYKAQLNSVEYNNSLGWGNLVTANSSCYEYVLDTSWNPSRYFVNLSLVDMNVAWSNNVTNGTVLARLKYSYNVPISVWQVIQNATNEPVQLRNITNSITQTYYETFRIYDQFLVSGTNSLMNVTLAYVPFYRDGVTFLSLWNKSNTLGDENYRQVSASRYKITLPSNNMTFVTNASSDYRVFFSANFTIQFDQPLNPPDIYTVDRLARESYIREHWYYVKVTGGPNLLRIKNVMFNDTNINYNDTISTSTYFGRSISKENNFYSYVKDDITYEIYNGTTLKGGYFVSGETDVLILSYRAERNLTILIADQILTPVPGASVTLFRDGIQFGTYLSHDLSFTQCPKIADERGIVMFPNLPSFGNYSIRVDYAGTNYGIYYVDLKTSTNILTTTIPHAPTWIIIWSTFCGFIVLIGFFRYRQYRNVSETTESR